MKSVDCLRVNSFVKAKRKLQSRFFPRKKITALDSLKPRHVAVNSECGVRLAGPISPWSVEGAVKHILSWLGPFPPLQPYPVQRMRPLLTPTLIAFSRLGCGAFWVGAGIFFMAINQKQQCRFTKKL